MSARLAPVGNSVEGRGALRFADTVVYHMGIHSYFREVMPPHAFLPFLYLRYDIDDEGRLGAYIYSGTVPSRGRIR